MAYVLRQELLKFKPGSKNKEDMYTVKFSKKHIKGLSRIVFKEEWLPMVIRTTLKCIKLSKLG